MEGLKQKPLVVIDINCLLQILGRHSVYHHLWYAFLQESFVLCMSNEILNEYEEILSKKASPRVAYLFMQVIARSGNVLRKDPYFKFELIDQDVDDNKFIDCAIVVGADYIQRRCPFSEIRKHSVSRSEGYSFGRVCQRNQLYQERLLLKMICRDLRSFSLK